MPKPHSPAPTPHYNPSCNYNWSTCLLFSFDERSLAALLHALGCPLLGRPHQHGALGHDPKHKDEALLGLGGPTKQQKFDTRIIRADDYKGEEFEGSCGVDDADSPYYNNAALVADVKAELKEYFADYKKANLIVQKAEGSKDSQIVQRSGLAFRRD